MVDNRVYSQHVVFRMVWRSKVHERPVIYERYPLYVLVSLDVFYHCRVACLMLK